MVSGFFASVQGKEIAGKIVVAKVRNSQRTNDPLLNQRVSVATIQWENILETVNSETTNWYTRSYNGAFSLSFIGTIMKS